MKATYFERLDSRTGFKSYMPDDSSAPFTTSAGTPKSLTQSVIRTVPPRCEPDERPQMKIRFGSPPKLAAFWYTQATARRTCSTMGNRLPPASSTLMKSSTARWAPALTNRSALSALSLAVPLRQAPPWIDTITGAFGAFVV